MKNTNRNVLSQCLFHDEAVIDVPGHLVLELSIGQQVKDTLQSDVSVHLHSQLGGLLKVRSNCRQQNSQYDCSGCMCLLQLYMAKCTI